MRAGGVGLVDGAVRLSGRMHCYHLFGGILASEIEFPGLPSAPPGKGRWSLTCAAPPASADPLPRLGAEAVTGRVRVVLRGSPSRFRLTYDDTGAFEITDGGRRIVWHRPAGASVDLRNVRADILGRVVAVALAAAGIPTFHGSGVALGGRGVLFLAPKRHGKSTAAAALVRAGARLWGTTRSAWCPGREPMVLPGVPAVNLWRDAARWLQPTAVLGETGRKRRINWGSLGERAEHPVPLGAVYLLDPADAGEVRREPLPAVPAALALVGQAKIGALLGPGHAPTLLAQCVRLSAAVPVYRLTVPRDLSRIGELVRCVGEWHDTPLRAAGGAPVP